MYRAGIEGIIGLTRAADTLILDPCFPAQWPGVSALVRHAGATVQIEVINLAETGHGIARVELDGLSVPHQGGPYRLRLQDKSVRLRLILGPQPD